MADTALNRYLMEGTAAQRAGYTPVPAAVAAGQPLAPLWFETDTGKLFVWNSTTNAWVQAGGAGMTLIGSVIAAAGATTVTFSGIPAAFSNLHIDANIATTGTSTSDPSLSLQFNGDTAANYSSVGVGTVPFSNSSTSSAEIGFVSSGSTPGSGVNMSQFAIDFAGYSLAGSFNKGFTATYGGIGSTAYAGSSYGQWNSQAAIASISFALSGGGVFRTGSLFSLYGKA